jgi:hypothetical protein
VKLNKRAIVIFLIVNLIGIVLFSYRSIGSYEEQISRNDKMLIGLVILVSLIFLGQIIYIMNKKIAMKKKLFTIMNEEFTSICNTFAFQVSLMIFHIFTGMQGKTVLNVLVFILIMIWGWRLIVIHYYAIGIYSKGISIYGKFYNWNNISQGSFKEGNIIEFYIKSKKRYLKVVHSENARNNLNEYLNEIQVLFVQNTVKVG